MRIYSCDYYLEHEYINWKTCVTFMDVSFCHIPNQASLVPIKKPFTKQELKVASP